MPRRPVFLLAWALAWSTSAFGQIQPPPDGVEVLLEQLETLLQAGDRTQFASLLSDNIPVDEAEQFTAELFGPNIRKVVVTEREREALQGALPGDGYRLVAEFYTESAGRARILTTLLDARRPSGGEAGTWRVMAARGLSSVQGLFRLRLDPSVQFSAQNLTVTAEDLLLTLHEGAVFPVESEDGVTGLVLLGRGSMRFTPAPETEKGQLRLFAGSETLLAPFDSAFVRLNPSEYGQRVSVARLTPAPPNPRQVRRAQEVLSREGPKSFSLDLQELSTEPWYLLPQPGDFLAEVRTRRYGTLTYMRALAQAEDITLFDRDRSRTISVYPSAERLAADSGSFNDDTFGDYDVLDYNIEASVSPDREFIDARARLRLRVRTPGLAMLTLRLADALDVTGVASVEYGRLLHLRIRDQDSVIVSLPTALARDAQLTLVVSYAGQVTPQDIEDELVQVGGQSGDEPGIPPEPNFLLSTRSIWYPQNPIADYATATLRITVPEGFGCVATGYPELNDDSVTLRDLVTLAGGKAFRFNAADPVRYLALVVSRFVRVAETSAHVPDTEEEPDPDGLRIAIEAPSRQQGVARSLMLDAEAILRFYAGVIGDAPYASTTVALVEHELPGGHSPAYFAVLNSPPPASKFTWRNDPAAFSGFPEFFIAHELAHQWWGQAVGWRNYHEQWLSEGFAQYFSALYAQHARGQRAFVSMLRQFRSWAIAESDEGPISLGYRLGHIRGEPRVFRALVYNKGAAVLHMLRRLVGDETFFRGLRRFYSEQKFRKASTADLQRAFEAESGRTLERFFEGWVHGAEVPVLRYDSVIGAGSVMVRFEQVGKRLFDIPVTVSLTYADGRTEEVVVPVTEREVEWRVATTGVVRQVQVNRDFAAVARFEES